MCKHGVASVLLALLLALGWSVWVSAAPSLPALPGAVASGPTRPYTDAELGFELLLPDKWQAVGHEPGAPGAAATGETAWREFRATDAGAGTNAGSGTGVWVRVIRTQMQLDPATGRLAAADRDALSAWLSSSYYAWRWVTQLSPPGAASTAGSSGPVPFPSPSAAAGSALVVYGSGEGIDSTGEKVQLHLWVFAVKEDIPAKAVAPLYLFVAGGPASQVERELGLLKAMVATFRPLAATIANSAGAPDPTSARSTSSITNTGTTISTGTPADLLLPLDVPELQLVLKQPRGWEVYVGRQGAERLVQLAAADGKALVLIHLISYDALSFGEGSAASGIGSSGTTGSTSSNDTGSDRATSSNSTGSGSVGDKDAVQLLGRAYLANLTVPAEEGGEGIAVVDVKVAGLTGTAPARFEAIFTYDDSQVGPAAGWLLVQMIPAVMPETSPTVLVLEARAVADRFDALYPTFRVVSESIRLLPEASTH